MSINPNRQEIVQDTNMNKIEKTDPKRDMRKMFEIYLANNPSLPSKKTSELELRFKAPKGKRLTKTDYDNVIQHLYAAGFTTSNPKGLHILRIQKQYLDPKKGITKLSNIRAEIVGVDLIQEYCRTNSIQKLLNMPSTMSAFSEKIKFTQKTPVVDTNQRILMPVNFADFNFRIGYQFEQEFGPRSELIRDMVETKAWADSKKVFRHLNRVKFEHPDYPFIADISIVRGSRMTGDVPIPEYTIQDAGVFENAVSYEVELELVNRRVGPGTKYDTLDKLLDGVRKGIRIILSALQESNYPISNKEQADVLKTYLKILHGDKYDTDTHRVKPRDFIGPNSVSLLMENILPLDKNVNIPNIRDNYCVTEKADGERKLLYIHDNGHIYMINTNMNVQFTGAFTGEKKIFGSILDGEHIKYDKTGKFINLFAAFDIYFLKKRSLREYPFLESDIIPAAGSTEGPPNRNFRLVFLDACIKLIKPKSITETSESKEEGCNFRIQCKEFYKTTEKSSIFDNSALILTKIKDGLFEYNTDGLIYTPMSFGVGGNHAEKTGRLQKMTWEHSFKWKPPHFNTIDFLVRVQKDKSDVDKVFTIFKDGVLMDKENSAIMYKKLILHCGFDEKIHGFLNPFQDMVDGNIPSSKHGLDETDEYENTYKARPFIPNNPFDETASICNIEIKKDGNGQTYMTTEDGDYFQENMIVEFKYNMDLTGGWRWVPIRVRHDKTSMLNHGQSSFGNDYTTANNNWKSIHNPVTEEIIMSGLGWSKPDDEVYYNRKSMQTNTRALRDFHNLYVKSKLIHGATNPNDILIDLSVGKGGDLQKWQAAKLKFVLGIDISKDNIMNNYDGACARYLRESRKYSHMPGALFLNGNSALNIRNGQAFTSYKEQKIIRSVFGEGAQNRKELGDGVYKFHGIAQDGFNVASCQFSLHYFFESQSTLHNFLRNLAECTRIGGTFIGTCYDGKSVFELLKNKEEGDGITIMREGVKMFQIVKLYNNTGFPDDEESIGYPINVYQESINNVFREYLVNFDYFKTLMSNYGFELITREEAVKVGLPAATGMFEQLYYDMEDELKRNSGANYKDAVYMTEDEKMISFLNRYFVFRKLRHVATKNIGKIMGFEEPDQDLDQDQDIEGISKKMASKKVQLGTEKPGVDKKEKLEDKKKTIHFIRKIEHPKITISVYDPPAEQPDTIAAAEAADMVMKPAPKVEEAVVPEIVSIPEPEEENTAIKIAPPKIEKKTIRIKKTAK